MLQSKTILNALPHILKTVDIPSLGKKQQGKVRDFYVLPDKRVIITTDRQSGFDINLGFVPYKGAVLNMLSGFWFEECRDIVPNHIISIPDPNVTIARNCEGINIEMIVRGYITGVTITSPWGNYEKGERMIYGIKFPDGLRKNQKLPKPILTPTTHGSPSTLSTSSGQANSGFSRGKSGHDERLTREEIIERKIVPEKLYKQMEEAALALFERGTQICEKAGLILVDTKYEFGLYDGELMQIDEMHTPDSSRFWIKDTYQKRFEKGEEPDNYDKEFIRLWYAKRVDPYKDKILPMSKDLIVQASQRYISIYEKITGKKFNAFKYPIEKRIIKNINNNL